MASNFLTVHVSAVSFEEFCGQKQGFGEFLRLTCKNCGHSQNFQSSKRVKGSYESNVRSVLASQPIGRAGLQTFAGIMNLPKPLSKRSYNDTQDKFLDQAKLISEELLNQSAKTLFEITSKNNPENIVEYENEKYAKVAVSVDGTWMGRGHQSKLGAIFVQSVETGEVLDYAVKSLFCHKCAKQKSSFRIRNLMSGISNIRTSVL